MIRAEKASVMLGDWDGEALFCCLVIKKEMASLVFDGMVEICQMVLEAGDSVDFSGASCLET